MQPFAHSTRTCSCLKPLRPLLQLDAWEEPESEYADEEGHRLIAGCQVDRRATNFPVRVQILAGTPRETAIALLIKLTAWLVRDWEQLDSFDRPLGPDEICPF